MNLVNGTEIHPVLVGINESYARLWLTVHQVKSISQTDVAAILQRNLLISWGLQVVDTLLLTLQVQEVLNFE